MIDSKKLLSTSHKMFLATEMGKEWLSQSKVISLWTGNIPTSLQYCSSNKSVSAGTASFQGEREMWGEEKNYFHVEREGSCRHNHLCRKCSEMFLGRKSTTRLLELRSKHNSVVGFKISLQRKPNVFLHIGHESFEIELLEINTLIIPSKI